MGRKVESEAKPNRTKPKPNKTKSFGMGEPVSRCAISSILSVEYRGFGTVFVFDAEAIRRANHGQPTKMELQDWRPHNHRALPRRRTAGFVPDTVGMAPCGNALTCILLRK